MGEENNQSGEIQRFNASKEIANQRDVKLIMNHVIALRQARTGETPVKNIYEMKNNEKKMNQVRGLNQTIQAQRDLISISRSLVRAKSENFWKKQYNKDEREEHPFEEYECDYKRLMYIRAKLEACEMDILEAEKTATIKDDFLVKRNTDDGEEFFLTDNFREMLKELEDSYEELESIMYRNGVISSGMEYDEERTNRELEDEFLRRGKEA